MSVELIELWITYPHEDDIGSNIMRTSKVRMIDTKEYTYLTYAGDKVPIDHVSTKYRKYDVKTGVGILA